MPKSDLQLSNGDYAPVADRIRLFYEAYPQGRIVTRLVSRRDREILFRAAVFRTQDDDRPAATGWASERVGDGDINTVACLENTETSAIGRALVNLGFTASRHRPSAEEMAKAERARTRCDQQQPVAVPAATAPSTLAIRPRAVREAGPVAADPVDQALQIRADAVSDFLDLVRAAEHAGLRPHRARALGARALRGEGSPEVMRRFARRLRRWVLEHSARQIGQAPPSAGASGSEAPRPLA